MRKKLKPAGLPAGRVLPEENHRAVLPPSTRYDAPVTNDALSDARNMMVWAISSGLPTRLSGTVAAKLAFLSGVPVKRSSIPVSIGPGATMLMRTPDAAASSAADLVSPSTACLLAAYTLYKWWPTKATLVLAMLCERMAPKLEKPTVLSAEQSLRFRVRSLIDAFNGPFGKIVAGLIAEGQSEPAILQEFFDRWVSPRRNATIADLQRGKDAGELRSETEPELLNDAIFGAIYYRMLLRYGPMTRRFGEGLVDQVIRGHRSGSARG